MHIALVNKENELNLSVNKYTFIGNNNNHISRV